MTLLKSLFASASPWLLLAVFAAGAGAGGWGMRQVVVAHYETVVLPAAEAEAARAARETTALECLALQSHAAADARELERRRQADAASAALDELARQAAADAARRVTEIDELEQANETLARELAETGRTCPLDPGLAAHLRGVRPAPGPDRTAAE